MPTKMAPCCRQKAVLVTMYVERPRRRVLSNHHHHHHHHHHHIRQQEVLTQRKHDTRNTRKGYDRRAQLLQYSQRLRESARSAPSKPLLHPKPVSSINQQPTTTQESSIIVVRSKPTPARQRQPTCLSNLKVSIPNFLKSLLSLQAKKKNNRRNSGPTIKKMKAVMKSFEVQKKMGFVSKMLRTLKNR